MKMVTKSLDKRRKGMVVSLRTRKILQKSPKSTSEVVAASVNSLGRIKSL